MKVLNNEQINNVIKTEPKNKLYKPPDKRQEEFYSPIYYPLGVIFYPVFYHKLFLDERSHKSPVPEEARQEFRLRSVEHFYILVPLLLGVFRQLFGLFAVHSF